jgi:arylsulfatase A-like enzyme
VADTLRADFVSTVGGEPGTTPHLERLAADGVVFENAHAAASWTTPSFASLLSSSYPSEHRAGERFPGGERLARRPLIRRLRTLTEVLASHGYVTAAVLSNAFLGPFYGIGQGFDLYENYRSERAYHPPSNLVHHELLRAIRPGYIRPYLRGPQQTPRILRRLDTLRATGRPYFLLAHLMDAHRPYIAPARFYRGEAASVRDHYRAEVRHLDEHVGTILDALRDSGEYDRMLIVFTSDHGEELLENRMPGKDYDHGHTLFEELLRVPLIIKLPGNRLAGTRRSDLVSLVDVAPSVLRALGLPVPRRYRGIDLLDERGPSLPAESRIVFAETLLHVPEQKAALRSGQKVLLRRLPADPRHAAGYDLERDPEERGAFGVEDGFQGLFEALARHAGPARLRPPSGAPAPALDPLHREQLEALGYGD